MRVVELLKRQWCEIIWFSCNTAVARKRFIKKNKNSATYFDTKLKTIEENTEKIIKNLNPKVIGVLKENKADKTNEEIYAELASILDAS